MKLRSILTLFFLLTAFASFGENSSSEVAKSNTYSRSFDLFGDILQQLLAPFQTEEVEAQNRFRDGVKREPITLDRITKAIADPILEMLWIKDSEEGGRLPIYLLYLGIPILLACGICYKVKMQGDIQKRDQWALTSSSISALFLFFVFFNVLGVVFILFTYNYYLANLRGRKCSKCSKYKVVDLCDDQTYNMLEPAEKKAVDAHFATVHADKCEGCKAVSIQLELVDDCSFCTVCNQYTLVKSDKIVKEKPTSRQLGLSVTRVTCSSCKSVIDEIENGIPMLSTYSSSTYTSSRRSVYDDDDDNDRELRRERERNRQLERALDRERSANRSTESSGLGSIVKDLLPAMPGRKPSFSEKKSSSSSSSSKGSSRSGGSSSGGGSRSGWGGLSRGGGSSSGGGSKSGW